MNATLPANKPGRFDVKLISEPRRLYPVSCDAGSWQVELTAISMEEIRDSANIRCLETPVARRNLQVWVNHLGPALYNPVLWYKRTEKAKLEFPYGMRSGGHRTRALEALDFNFAYIYLLTGVRPKSLKYPPYSRKIVNKNAQAPYVSSRPGLCPNCGRRTNHLHRTGNLYFVEKCYRCNYEKVRSVIYPEPV